VGVLRTCVAKCTANVKLMVSSANRDVNVRIVTTRRAI
jgi:hypothetical protein